ncbi:hypothetical protein ACM55G_14620 [Flavobacterium sp. LB3P122]|uniref:hypothetical protein n=1 Tax=Flavobacterium algoriphilum TaxID=3398738 RepID=UPI003A85C901
MSNENIISRIALLQEQIDNLEKSGHFTEKEMDSQTFAFRTEIEALKAQVFPLETVLGVSQDELSYLVETLKDCFKTEKTTSAVYGITRKSYTEGARKHTLLFSQMPSPALLNTWNTLGINLAISKG